MEKLRRFAIGAAIGLTLAYSGYVRDSGGVPLLSTYNLSRLLAPAVMLGILTMLLWPVLNRRKGS